MLMANYLSCYSFTAHQDSEKQQETALQQTQVSEEDHQEDFSITAVRFHDGEKEINGDDTTIDSDRGARRRS